MSTPTRTLADDLRGRSDDDLARLVTLRPDLLHPVPPDVTALVSRASTSTSIARALDRLDAWSLQVLEAIASLPDPCRTDDLVVGLPGVEPGDIDRALAALRERALLWGTDDELHLVRAAREGVGPYPGGLHSGGLIDLQPDDVTSMMATAPAESNAVVDQLLWGPPVGTVANADRPVTERTARTPIEWLLARGLLQPLGSDRVVLPREVALPLRHGALVRDPQPWPPTPDDSSAIPQSDVDRACGQAALSAVRWVEDLLEEWSVNAPAELRSGGVSVKDLTGAARLLDVDESTAALVVGVAHAAGLLASDEEERPVWLPTAAYDLWLSHDIAERWVVLAAAWIAMPRIPALVGTRDQRGSRVNALTAETERPDASEVRRMVLSCVASAPSGAAISAAHVRSALAWHRPRRASATRDLLVDSSLHEAAVLGVMGRGALGDPARRLLEQGSTGKGRRTTDSETAAADAMRPLLPHQLDHVLLQADLTAVAPGPLEPELTRELRLMADVESTGGATVYRISADSLRRAFDAGRSASDVTDFLTRSSRTPVPQPLTYLVDDVARKHGVVRVGSAQSYVRCDDEAAITAILTDKKAASLRAVRLAPGVLALQAPVDEALTVLRSIGLAPAAESADGTVLVRRQDSRRSRGRPRPMPVESAGPDPVLVSAAVRALRAGDRIATGSRRREGPERLGTIPLSSTNETLAALRAAIAEQRSIWIGYADTDGRATERVIDPVEISRGFLTAYDHRYEEVRSFALARITGVAEHESVE